MATEAKGPVPPSTPPAPAPAGVTGSPVPENRFRTFLIFGAVGVFAAIIFGLLYLFVIAPTAPGSSMGWFLFSFATGITMIIMPCTLPLAFVIVPLAMGKGLVKGLSMALAFGLGVAVTQSLYGVIAALLGSLAIGALGAPLEEVKNWVYLVAGIFALTFALGEIGLVKFRMPTYSGAAPAFIQKRRDAVKAFLLGLFLGNVGVGCPHPATPLLLIEAASSGNIAYGWVLFLVHSIGRILPLLLLAFLGILGVNGLGWLVTKKDAVERASGWAMVFVAGFILTLGLFTHKWWVNSGIHSLLEKVTQESWFNSWFNNALNTSVAHVHGLETGTGMFSLPLSLGHWFLVAVWIIPIWWWWFRKRKNLMRSPAFRIRELEARMDHLEKERRQVEGMVALDDVEVDFDLKAHEAEVDRLETLRRAEEEKVAFADKSPLANPVARSYEMRILSTQRNYLLLVSAFIVLTFAYFLPKNFELNSLAGLANHGHTAMTASSSSTGTPFSTAISNLPDAVPTETVVVRDGETYAISAGYVRKTVGNRELRMLAYNGSVPGPFIKAQQGSTIHIDFTNNTDIDQTIHSHGVRVDNLSDGVPGVTQQVVRPGERYTYDITFEDAGVYWFHPHTREDYGQELGLYGNYIVTPIDTSYYSPVNREIPLVIDDILIANDKIAPFYKEYVDHTLTGRFGNEFLVNGMESYSLNFKKGEVVRFLVTNVSNARTYNFSIPGAKMKLVAADIGKFEKEMYVDSFILSPAERTVVEVYFEKPGAYSLVHTVDGNTTTLATFGVSSEETVDTSFASEFNMPRINDADAAVFAALREQYMAKAPDKRVAMTISLMPSMLGVIDHSQHAHSVAAVPGVPSLQRTGIAGIQWDDKGNTDWINTTQNVTWKLVDLDTKLENHAINWTFKQNTYVKVRFTNDTNAAHVMQHPIHFHGQRFLVLARNDVPNQNLAWKDTALVLPGENLDILVEMSNLGAWMAHCHIAEHLHGGMMLNFRVEDGAGYATGDEFRASLPPPTPTMPGMGTMSAMMGGTLLPGMTASTSLTYGMTLPPSNFVAIPERVFLRQKTKEDLKFEIQDLSGASIKLNDALMHPLVVTFVKSDDKIRAETYPGNTNLGIPVVPVVPNGQPFDESQPHTHPTVFNVELIPMAYAHGTLNDGHTGTVPTAYSYTVPVYLPEKGAYRVFVQFVPAGGSEVRTASFNIEVGAAGWSIDNYGWSKQKKWWILTLFSILLMTPLCIFVRRYIGSDKAI